MAPKIITSCFLCPIDISGTKSKRIAPVLPPQSFTDRFDKPRRRLREFKLISKIGKGSYGAVFYASDNLAGGKLVILKQITKKENGKIPKPCQREIRHLRECTGNPFVVQLKSVVYEKYFIYLVFEPAGTDLHKCIKHRKDQLFTEHELKLIVEQLLQGVAFLHSKSLVHRDLKTQNLLITGSGDGYRLKIADFGNCKRLKSKDQKNATGVGTVRYLAPEILLGAENYSTSVDMWSVGCIMAELVLLRPLFHGEVDLNQIYNIIDVLGLPSKESWPEFEKLSTIHVREIEQGIAPEVLPVDGRLRELFTGDTPLSGEGFDLLSKLLAYNPSERITASEALEHEWFRTSTETLTMED